MKRIVTSLIAAIAAVIVNGCTDNYAPAHRAAEVNLTREHAQARAERIREVSYDLEFQLDGEAEEYTGRAIIAFRPGHRAALQRGGNGKCRGSHVHRTVAARPDPEQQRRLMQQLLDPDSGLRVADARASAGGLFPVHQQALQLQIVSEVLNKLQYISDNIDPGYFRSITGGLLGVICDESYLAQLEQAVNRSETLHPLLRKRLLDMRFDVRRCLAIGAASAPGL